VNAPTSRSERRVHLNTAGTGRMPAAVRAVLAECARREDRYGHHELEEDLEDVLHTEIHERLAGLLNVPAGDTVLCTGAADAFAALLARLPLGPGDRVWTTPYESAANLTALFALRDRTRCRLDVVPLRPDGDVDLEWMAEHVDERVALVSLTHVPSGCGIVSPVEAVGRILAPHRCLYAVDASHAAGQLPLDASRIGCQLLTGDGWRFLRGPYGVGFAYVAPQLRRLPAPAGTEPPRPPEIAAVAAFHTALAQHAAATVAPYEDLLPALRAAVEAAPGAELIAPGRTQSGILAFRHAGLPAGLIRRGLAERGVVVGKTVGQEVPLFMPGRGITTAVRVSVHLDNAPGDIDRFGEALAGVLAQERAGAVPAPRALHTATPQAPAPAQAPAQAPVQGSGARIRLPRQRAAAGRHLTLVSGTDAGPQPAWSGGGAPLDRE